MNRWILFPATVATAWAQQTSPAAPAETEQALRDRVQQFFQLEVDKKFRQAEALVAEDSKDYFYDAKKPDIKGFSIDHIDWDDNHTRATVTISAKTAIFLPAGGLQVFEMKSPTYWKLDDGQWCWYFDREARRRTPFGMLTPETVGLAPAPAAPGPVAPPRIPPGFVDPTTSGVKLDRTSVVLTAGGPVQSVTVTNSLPGPVDLQLDDASTKVKGLSVQFGKTHLAGGETTEIRLGAEPGAKLSNVIRVLANPLPTPLDIQVGTQ